MSKHGRKMIGVDESTHVLLQQESDASGVPIAELVRRVVRGVYGVERAKKSVEGNRLEDENGADSTGDSQATGIVGEVDGRADQVGTGGEGRRSEPVGDGQGGGGVATGVIAETGGVGGRPVTSAEAKAGVRPMLKEPTKAPSRAGQRATGANRLAAPEWEVGENREEEFPQ